MKIAIVTGPRAISADDEKLVRDVVRELIARGFAIYGGDAAGVDEVTWNEAGADRKLFQPLPELGRTPAGLAERSTRCVKEALHDAAGDEIICIGFPNKPCPAGIVPARSWKSGGSGTWSTLALAIGHKIETWIIPLGDNNISKTFYCSLPWGNWKQERFNSFYYGWHRAPAPEFNFFNTVPSNALTHDELANGWTELAREQEPEE